MGCQKIVLEPRLVGRVGQMTAVLGQAWLLCMGSFQGVAPGKHGWGQGWGGIKEWGVPIPEQRV